jgi:hypothetical protein
MEILFKIASILSKQSITKTATLIALGSLAIYGHRWAVFSEPQGYFRELSDHSDISNNEWAQALIVLTTSILAILTVYSLAGLGGLTRKIFKLPKEDMDDVTFGPLPASWSGDFIMGTATFGLLSFLGISLGTTLCLGVSTICIVLGMLCAANSPKNHSLGGPWWKEPASIVCVFYLVARGAQVVTPDMHPDALWYHLTGPLSWIKNNGFYFSSDAVQLMQASVWESIYLWPLLILGSSISAELVSVQIFSQILVFCAAVTTSVTTAKLLKKVMPFTLEASWQALVILAVFLTTEMVLSLPTPKNDWGVAAWFILAVFYLTNSNHIVAALLFGLAFASKLSYGIVIMPICIIGLNYLKSNTRRIQFLSMIIGAALPVLIRNHLLVGNPFFPTLENHLANFRGYQILPKIWLNALSHFSSFSFVISVEEISKVVLATFPPNQLFSLLILAPLARNIWQSFWGSRIYITIFVSLALFVVLTGDKAEVRLIGAIPILVAGLSIYGFYAARQSLGIRLIPVKILPLVAAAYLVLFSEKPWGRLFPYDSLARPVTTVKSNPTIAVINEFSKLNGSIEKILLAFDTRLFYVFNYGVVRAWDSKRISDIFEKTDARQIIKSLTPEFRYLLVTYVTIDNFQAEGPVNLIVALTDSMPDSIVARFNGGILIDMFKLQPGLK